ncbi:hypothetical protein K8B33_07560 [Alcanivorax sp. JB21]|uniref:ATP-binding protein n=1 Tax=Alcanivorax limicola TaxID=2874102 RepID=UPI001CBEE051|nr:ATP-binding protein [Alcanivorax limicola]MBZ2188948.1 hypothetical protein [Alcanivorax limicola]
MYSFFPAIIAVLFLGYGLYVLKQRGSTPVTRSFFVLCFTTFMWQATWAVLFQVTDPDIALRLAHVGYLMILFLPTSLYHFLVSITGREQEYRLVYLSYAVAAVLALLLFTTPWIVSGTYDYFFGPYPKAGLLHPLHVLQTCVVVLRGLYITWRAQADAAPRQRIRLRYCVASLLIYLFAAVDYLCNYGMEFYPPGVFLIFISLGILTLATVRHQLMDVSVVVSQGLARLMTLSLFALLYLGSLILLHAQFPGAPFAADAIIGVLWLILVSESYAPLRRALQGLPDRLLQGSRQRYRYSDVVQALTEGLSRHITLSQLAETLERVMAEQAHISPVRLLVREGIAGGHTELGRAGFFLWDTRACALEETPALQQDHTLFQEVTADQPIGHYRELSAASRTILRQHDAMCAIVVRLEGEPLAVLLLGKQAGFVHYTHEDLNLLELLPGQLALALDKVHAYARVSAGLARAGKTASLMTLMNEYQHELKAPVSIMHMYAQSDMGEGILREEVMTQCHRLLGLLEQMLRVLQDDRARDEKPVPLNAVVQTALRLFPPRQAQISLALDPAQPMLLGDADDLLILCINLLKNAAEASVPEKPNLITVTTRSLNGGRAVSLTVADTGAGMSPAQLREQTAPLASTKAGGSGLGLKVIRRVAAEHLGQVRLDSPAETGTRVEIRFPSLASLRQSEAG